MIRLKINVNDNREHLKIEMGGLKLMATKEEQKFVDFLTKSIDNYKKIHEMTFSELTNEIQNKFKSIIDELEG